MNLFDLFVRVGVKDEATEQIGGIKATTIAAGQLMADGIKVAGRAVASFSKQAIAGYAEYEQLSGGVETLFGKSADTVMKYAEQAYKTAGLSANEYMSTVTSFSASLLQSLGGNTEEAAELADQAIRDMSDNANKMGTDMNAIQNAYQGFAKQNYTMLDNLKLGYGGTKEEMQRLLDKANELNAQQGIITDYQIDSYADIVDAIHVVQAEMDITGTTAKEASTTISGSVSSMKSAWQNLVTGISDENANLEQLVGNFVDSAITAAGNIAPRIEQALSGIGMLGEKIAPVIVDGISAAVEKAPEFLAAGENMLVSLGNALMDQSDLLIQNAFDLILVLADGLIQGVGGLADSALELVEKLAMWVEEYSDVLGEKAVTLILTLVNSIVKNLPKLAVASLRIMASIGTALIDNLPELIKQIPTIIAELVNGFADAMPDIIAVGEDIVRGLWEGIKSLSGWIGEKVTGFFNGLFDEVKENEEIHSPSRKWAMIGKNDALGVGKGWADALPGVRDKVMSGLDFGTSTVDFASSGIGRSSAGIINSVANIPAQNAGGATVNLMLPDGTVLARYYLKSFISEAAANGTPIANPV